MGALEVRESARSLGFILWASCMSVHFMVVHPVVVQIFGSDQSDGKANIAIH